MTNVFGSFGGTKERMSSKYLIQNGKTPSLKTKEVKEFIVKLLN